MTSFQKSAIISCKTCLGGGVLWHLHQEIVHQGAEQIHQKELEKHLLVQEKEKHHLKHPEKM